MTISLKELLFHHFTEWQRAQREIKNVKEFASFVGIDYKVLDHLFNERRGLSPAVADKLAKALNDLQFYDLADLPRPDALTFYIERSLIDLDEVGKQQVANEIAKHIGGKPPSNTGGN